MASLLVYVGEERLRELLADYAPGDTWHVKTDMFSQPQLERLDEHSWLFVTSGDDHRTRCIAVLRHPQFENGIFVGGTADVVDRDITHLVTRLGCAGPQRMHAWAGTPRILPPSDLDLLRYALGLSDDDSNIPVVLPDDDRTHELRAAVWEDPASDDARMVYADYLQDRGDPRGELVALQVARARSGEPQTDRERQLLRHIAKDIAQPLAPYLLQGFEIERGFITKCSVSGEPMPREIREHVAWRTVDDLSTTNFDLLTNPNLRARRVGMTGRQLERLVEHVRPLPFETVVGIAPVGKSQRGVALDERGWDVIAGIGALTQMRTLSVNPEKNDGLLPRLLRSPLGGRLLQLDAFLQSPFAAPTRWREAFDLARTPLLTLRFMPITPEAGRVQWLGAEVLVGLRRTARAPHLVVQVEDILTTENVTAVMRFVAQVSRNIQIAELHDFGGPATRNAVLVERMNAMFSQVLVQPASAKRLAP